MRNHSPSTGIFMELCHLGIPNRKCYWEFPAETFALLYYTQRIEEGRNHQFSNEESLHWIDYDENES
jgi:hypothetical protein